MTSDQTTPPRSAGAVLQTALLALGLVILVALIAAPGVMERIQYAKVRGELAAVRDAAAVREKYDNCVVIPNSLDPLVPSFQTPISCGPSSASR